MSKKPKGNNTAVVVLLTVLIFVMIALTGLVIWMCVNLVNKTPQTTVRTETQIYTLPTAPRTEPAQSGEHMIADEGQQAERDIVIAGLFAIAKQTAADAGQGQQRKEHGQ